jgi:hypothetical protein
MRIVFGFLFLVCGLFANAQMVVNAFDAFGGATYLLDGNVPEIAYSLKQLKTGVTSVVRVRRSSDDAESDFTASQVEDGTLTTWTSANNGFVVTMYDQGSLGIDALQSTPGYQPKIVSSGSLITIGSDPCIYFDGTDDFLDIGSSISASPSSYSYFIVRDVDEGSGNRYVFDTNTGRMIFDGEGTFCFFDGTFKGSGYGTSYCIASGILISGTGATTYKDGSTLDTGLGYTAKAISGTTTIGSNNAGSTNQIIMSLQCFIIFTSDQTSNWSTIESGLNDIYTVY